MGIRWEQDVTTRNARQLHALPPRGACRGKRPAAPAPLPSGVRPHILENGRRIIEEEREVLKCLEAYDRGEWRRR